MDEAEDTTASRPASERTSLASERTSLASARTSLASERTQLAWWRTGFAALAVAVAIGSIVPKLAQSTQQWPYTVIGVGFALYGIALIAYGTARARQLEAALLQGAGVSAHSLVVTVLTAAGIGLSAATAVLIVVAS